MMFSWLTCRRSSCSVLSSLALAHEFSLGSVGSFIKKCLDYLHAHLPELAASLQSEKEAQAAAKTLETLPPEGLAALVTDLLKVAGAAETQLKQRKIEVECMQRRASAAEKRNTGYQRALDDVLGGFTQMGIKAQIEGLAQQFASA